MNVSIELIAELFVGAIIMASIPWAFVMERRLARIEARISNGFSDDIKMIRANSDKLSNILRNQESRLIKLELHDGDK